MEHKFKVGDRVRDLDLMYNCGEGVIERIDKSCVSCCIKWDNGHYACWRIGNDIELVCPISSRETIEITYKGDSTFVHIKADGKTFAGISRRDPSDKYDAETGFQWAYKRARAKQLGKEEPRVEKKDKAFKVGDRVEGTAFWHGKGRVVFISKHAACNIGVESDTPKDAFHDCDGHGKKSCCVYTFAEHLRHI